MHNSRRHTKRGINSIYYLRFSPVIIYRCLYFLLIKPFQLMMKRLSMPLTKPIFAVTLDQVILVHTLLLCHPNASQILNALPILTYTSRGIFPRFAGPLLHHPPLIPLLLSTPHFTDISLSATIAFPTAALRLFPTHTMPPRLNLERTCVPSPN